MDAALAEGLNLHVGTTVLAGSVAADYCPAMDVRRAAWGLFEDSLLFDLYRSAEACVARVALCLLPFRSCLRGAATIQARDHRRRIDSGIRHLRWLRLCETSVRHPLP